MSISPKENRKAQLEFKIAYFDSAVITFVITANIGSVGIFKQFLALFSFSAQSAMVGAMENTPTASLQKAKTPPLQGVFW